MIGYIKELLKSFVEKLNITFFDVKNSLHIENFNFINFNANFYTGVTCGTAVGIIATGTIATLIHKKKKLEYMASYKELAINNQECLDRIELENDQNMDLYATALYNSLLYKSNFQTADNYLKLICNQHNYDNIGQYEEELKQNENNTKNTMQHTVVERFNKMKNDRPRFSRS